MGVGEPLLNLELTEGVYEYEEYLKLVLGYESVIIHSFNKSIMDFYWITCSM